MSEASIKVPNEVVVTALDDLISEAKFKSDHVGEGEARMGYTVALAHLQRVRAKFRPPGAPRKHHPKEQAK